MFFFRYCVVTAACAVFLTACDGRLRSARQTADATGNPEMYRLVEHYKDDPEKLTAVAFLLENVAGHEARTFELVDSAGNASGFSLYRAGATSGRYQDMLDSAGLRLRRRTLPDAAVLTADYLIRDIDLAFDSWKNNSWSRLYSEEMFREYILPYRVADERISDWRSFLADRYRPMIDTMSAPRTVENVAALVISDIQKWYRYDSGVLTLETMPTPEEAYVYGKGECYSMANMFVLGLRAVGIAAATDVIPVWGTSRGGHAEAAYFDEYGNPVTLTTGSNLGAKPVRVYRVRYSRQHADREAAARGVSPFWEDVTALYTNTSDIRIPVDTTAFGPEERSSLGLAVYGSRSWRAGVMADSVSLWPDGESGRPVAHFSRIGRSILYMPAVVRGGYTCPVGEPFTLDYKGNIAYIRPDTSHRITLHLTTLLTDTVVFRPDDYRLLYWADGDWKEHPGKVETNPKNRAAYLIRDVPGRTFYRLHDRTTGRDYRNRPFTTDGWWIQRY